MALKYIQGNFSRVENYSSEETECHWYVYIRTPFLYIYIYIYYILLFLHILFLPILYITINLKEHVA